MLQMFFLEERIQSDAVFKELFYFIILIQINFCLKSSTSSWFHSALSSNHPQVKVQLSSEEYIF